MTIVSKQRRMLAILTAICLPSILAFQTGQPAAAASPSAAALGMRPSGGFLKQDRLDRYERELGQISWYVGMAGRQSPADMKGSVHGQMEARDAVLPTVADRMNVVMTVPLAFGKGSARTAAGRAAIKTKLLETAAGRWDDDYRKVAKSLIGGGYPDAVIRLGHEFTGGWYPWSAQGNEDAYVAAFRHVHDVMLATAPRLRFDWNAARNTFGEYGPAAYPGDDYVDVVSLDVYYEPWKGDPDKLTDDVWNRRYERPLTVHRDFAKQHGKPVAYPEWANGDVDQPKFIEKMHDWFGSLPASGGGSLLYHSYFNVNNDTYNLDRYPESKARYIELFAHDGTPAAEPPTTTAPPTTTVPPTTAPPTTAPITTTPPATAPAGRSGSNQFTFFDQTVVHRADQYATLDVTAPADWSAPTDFTDGTPYLRLDIADKPSDLPVEVLVCMWRDSYAQEKCASAGTFAAAGESWIRLKSPDRWWKKNKWDWDRPADYVRILVKDAATGTLLTSSRCGSACYKGGEDLADHTPITFDAAMVIVAPGAELDPLPDWGDCPTGFSDNCENTETRVVGAPTVSVPATMTATVGEPLTIPADIDADTVNWWKVSGSSLQWSSRSVEQPTVTFRNTGKHVLRVNAKRDGSSERADVEIIVGSASAPPATDPAPITTTPPATDPAPVTTTPPAATSLRLSVPATMTATINQPITIPADIEADSINWWRLDGPSMLWSDRSVEQPRVTFRKPGTYVLRVAAKLGDDRKRADVTVTVGSATSTPPSGSNTEPSSPTITPVSGAANIAMPTAIVATLGVPMTIPADIEADAVYWRRVSGPSMSWSDRRVEQPEIRFSKPGTYVLRVTATRDGKVSKADVEVTVRPIG